MVRRLLHHPEVSLVRVGSIDHVDEPIGHVHPNLHGATDLRFEALTPEAAVDGVDVVLLGLPHGASLEVVPRLLSAHPDVLIVDMSGAFRLDDPETYANRYGKPHPHPELLRRFVYGLPERHRERIQTARAVASPGCFATSVQLALIPLARRGLLQGDVHVVGMTGSSGAGAAALPTTHHPVRSVTLRPYAPLKHVQSFEMTEQLAEAGARARIQFVPVSAPLSRGILSIAQMEVDASEAELRAALVDDYADAPLVRVLEHRDPEVAAVAGSAYAEVGVRCAPDGSTAAVFCALDNLIKGGAGQAIQSMNLMLGLPETAGLEDPGSWP